MIKKLLLVTFIFLSVKLSIAQTSPTISNFRIEASAPSRIYFDSSEPITASTITGFVISGKTLSAITINTSQTTNHYFTITSEFSFWDNNTIRYEGGSDLMNDDDKVLGEFTLQHIESNILEPVNNYVAYFVRTTGNDDNDGLSHEKAFKTIAKAIKIKAKRIYIEIGNYKSLTANFNYNGTPNNPILIQGYRTISNGVPDPIDPNYWKWGGYGTENNIRVDVNELPTLEGESRNSGRGIVLNQNVILRNIQITKYEIGISFNSGRNVFIDNVVIVSTGNVSKSSASYGINGLSFLGHGKFKNITIADVGGRQAMFRSTGNFSLFENIRLYQDKSEGTSFSRPDYYFSLYGNRNCSNNIVKNVTVDRIGDIAGAAHGIGIKAVGGKSEYNLIENCTAINMKQGVELRHEEVKYNVIRNLESFKRLSDGSTETYGIQIRDGASYNNVENSYLHHLKAAISFYDNKNEQGIQHGGNNNTYKNLIIHDCKIVISEKGNINGSPSFENKFYNLTVDNCLSFSDTHKKITKSTIVKNSTFSNILKMNRSSNKPSPEFEYTKCNFYNIGFEIPIGNSIISKNPQFEAPNQGNYRLNSTSDLIDAGEAINGVNEDFEKKQRFQGEGVDIGAYEFQSNTTSLIDADAGEDTEICIGESATLTATGNGDFLWSTGETTVSIDVSPTETTIYTVTVSDSDDSESDEVEVTVNITPSVDLGDDVTTCLGESTVLTATGNGDFLWSTGETTANITVNPTSTEIYTVTASNSCSTNAEDQITVNVTPGISLGISDDVAICLGESITLTATSNGDFLWSTGETTASITVNPTETKIYTITSSLGNCTLSQEVEVLVDMAPSVSLGDDVIICFGESTTLTATGNGDFLWSTGETTASIIVSPISTETYTVIASSSSCSASVTDEITVNVTPEIVLDVIDAVTICSGESTTLTATGNGDFLWSTGETTASIDVSPLETTIYYITSSKGNCSLTNEIIVTVNDLPSVSLIDDNVSICSGDSIVLFAEGNGDFLWSTGETTFSIEVNPTETTTYSVTVSSSCSVNVTDEVVVNVNSTPNANAGDDVVIIEGERITLTATGNGDFLWSTGETTASITVQPNKTAIYFVEVYNGSCSDVDSVEVIVEEVAVTINSGSDITICKGEEVILNVDSEEATYTWSTGEVNSSIKVKPETTTIYSVTALTKNNIKKTTQIKVTINDCFDVSSSSKFNVYPNPSKGLINITLPSTLQTSVKLSLISLSGKVLYRKNIVINNTSVTTQIDLSNMPRGVYLVRIDNEITNEIRKILVI